MNGDDQDQSGALDTILILAPYRNDADYLERLCTEHDLSVSRCSNLDDLQAGLQRSAGVLVTAHEALNPEVIETVAAHLGKQPAWSEMPIIVLLDRASPDGRVRADLDKAWPRSRQLFYKRPLTPIELISGVQTALLARLRQRDVRDHIAREIELRRELNHRVKNILASVTSIFEMTRRGTTTMERVTKDFTGRLNALANVHSAVFHADGESVELADVAALTFQPYQKSGRARFVVEGPPVTLKREAGTTLALCLHELTTNAIKYGALSRSRGRVTFRWQVTEDPEPQITIEWHEKGGPVVREPERTGYGTRYLRSALTSAFGRPPNISFASDGLHCEISGPLSRITCNK